MYSVSKNLSFLSCPKKFHSEYLSDDPDYVRLFEENKSSPPLQKHEGIRRSLVSILRDPENADEYRTLPEDGRFIDNFLQNIITGDTLHFDDIGTYTTFKYSGVDVATQIFVCVEYEDEVVDYRLKSGRWLDEVKDSMHATTAACWYRTTHDHPVKPFTSRFMYLNERFAEIGHFADYTISDADVRDFIRRARAIEETIADTTDFFATPGHDACQFCPISEVCDEHDNFFRQGERGFPEIELLPERPAAEAFSFLLSHHSSIKEEIVKPFARKLESANLSYWLDADNLTWGGGAAQEINEALQRCEYVVYFLNREFFGSNWTRTEYFNRINSDIANNTSTCLPLIIDDADFVREQSPIQADTLYEHWDRNTITSLVRKLEELLRRR